MKQTIRVFTGTVVCCGRDVTFHDDLYPESVLNLLSRDEIYYNGEEVDDFRYVEDGWICEETGDWTQDDWWLLVRKDSDEITVLIDPDDPEIADGGPLEKDVVEQNTRYTQKG